MAERSFVVDCEPEVVRYRARFQCERGHVLNFVVQLEFRVNELWRPVIRYDTAHGHAHCDSYDVAGNVTPHQPLPYADYERALSYAVSEVKNRWPELVRPFREAQP